MRVCVTGDRYWRDAAYVWNVLDIVLDRYLTRYRDGRPRDLTEPFVLIQGGARGADKHAAEWALARADVGVESLTFEADWEHQRRAAGPIRNRKMLREGKPDLVIAFHDALTKSKGTADMVDLATKAGLEVWLIRHEDSFD